MNSTRVMASKKQKQLVDNCYTTHATHKKNEN